MASKGSSSAVDGSPTLPFADAQNPPLPEPESDYDLSLESSQFVPDKTPSKRPKENNFTQQRLLAYNPVFTARTVIPLLVTMAIIFVPLGGAMWLAAHRVNDFRIDYTQCEFQAQTDHWLPVPDQYLQYHINGFNDVSGAQWKLSTDESQQFEDERKVCQIQFHVPTRLKGPIYFFYRLEKFHQNHRRYAKSYSENQLNGKPESGDEVKHATGQNCEPLSMDEDGKPYYPCGLIANSLFNDTYSSTLTAVNGTLGDYEMTNSGIAWSTNHNRYKKTKYNYTEIAVPRNWVKKFPNGYNETNVPDISTWEEFQNWMFTSALPDFNKLALRNDHDALEEGIYQVDIGLHFPVVEYNGKKMIFISQRSALGGKNYFLGWSWIAGGGLCLVLAIGLLITNTVRPRKAGDENLLSWNKESFKKDEAPESGTASNLL